MPPRPVAILILLSTLTFFAGLGRQAITDSDEAYYAEAAREMVESGDWLTPHFNYEDRWQKPVLYYWLTAAAYLLAGPTESAARWWSAFSGLALALLTWRAARRLTTVPGAAWLAGAIVATCFGCFALARMALPDLPLAFFITAAVWMAIEERWLLAGLAAGLGFLTKGPLAVVVPAIVLLPVWWRERRDRAPRPAAIAAAGLVFALVGLPWFAAMTLQHGSAYLDSFFVGDNLERFATSRFNEPRPFWFYLPVLAGGLLPWSAYLLTLPWRSIVRIQRGPQPIAREDWLLAMWIGMPLLLFTISVGKQPRYILPILPPLAILVARSMASAAGDARSQGMLRIAAWLTSGVFGVMALLLLRARPVFIGTHPLFTSAAIGVLAIGALVLAWTAAREQWRPLPLRTAFCAAAFLLSVQFGALAGIRPEPVEQMAALIRAHGAGAPLGVYQVFVRNLPFYTHRRQELLFEEDQVRVFLDSPERVLLVLSERDLARVEDAAAHPVKRLGAVRYLNAADVRIRTVLAPQPETDIDTVLLVSNR